LRLFRTNPTFAAMSLIETSSAPTPPAKQQRSSQLRGKLKAAIEAMVWDGLPRKDAAAKAGMTEHGLYKALRKPPVKAAYLAELDVLRTSERARSVFRLTELRDQHDNKMVAFNAAKELAGSAHEAQNGAQTQALPGLVVVINAPSGTPLTQPAAKPLISLECISPAKEHGGDDP
jgi:hypothetical protein